MTSTPARTGSAPQLGSAPPVGLRAAAGTWQQMLEHVRSEGGHGGAGVLLCGVAEHRGKTWFLARNFIPAANGVDYVPGTVGHHALTAGFMRRALQAAAQQHLVPLFVHSHGFGNAVGFSETDLWSHERGYRALLDISGQSVGALVISSEAVAGDIWLHDGRRAALSTATIIGPNVLTVRPHPAHVQGHREQDDRQARLFGDVGQDLLRHSKIAVVGAGGAGLLAIEYLSRLGIGNLIVVDDDKVEITNLPRLHGATLLDAMAWLTASGRPSWMRRLGRRLSTPKVRLAARLARRAGQGTRVIPVRAQIQDPKAAELLKDCDYIVLAADTATARMVTNVISHQYLIPLVQVGVKIPVTNEGEVGDLFTAVRPVTPDRGCLRCARLIDPSKLALEALPDQQRKLADYGTGQGAPSVITLNAMAVSEATTVIMFALTGLHTRNDLPHARHHARSGEYKAGKPSRRADCTVCGRDGVTALGDLVSLPVRMS